MQSSIASRATLTEVERGFDLIRMEQITKRFPGVLANDRIDFKPKKGEIHALLGENGAGKTTLMNILYGLIKPDSGEIYLAGQKVILSSPHDAIKLGIGMVHQHFMLIQTLTVVENVMLGSKSARWPLRDTETISTAIKALSEAHGLKVDPNAKVWQLSIGEQQRVEIIKALYRGAQILILDEPTSVLIPQEVDELFEVLRSMSREGKTIIFISHKLREVIAISESITVLRAGKLVRTVNTHETDPEQLAEMMVGRKILFEFGGPKVSVEEQVILELIRVDAISDKGIPALRGVSLKVHAGEILGVAGVSGNGQRELAEVIIGLRKVEKGKVLLNNENIANIGTNKIMRKRVGYIPDDRLRKGLILDFSVAENLVLGNQRAFVRGILLDTSKVNATAEKLISKYDIKTPSYDTMARGLSGGNLQKLILARELSREPRLLVSHEPTRGLDVGATEYVRSELLRQKQSGLAILLISEDLDEIISLSDRIAVIYNGEIIGIRRADQASVSEIGLLMAGVKT